MPYDFKTNLKLYNKIRGGIIILPAYKSKTPNQISEYSWLANTTDSSDEEPALVVVVVVTHGEFDF